MTEGYIYKLVLNIDLNELKKGEVYIGKHNGAKPEYIGSGRIIRSIISKHGESVFDRTVICIDIDNNELLSFLEKYYISFYKCNRSKHKNGLNLTDGGEGIYGYINSASNSKSISERLKNEYKENKRRPPTEKTVYKYNLETLQLIGSYINCVEAAREVGCAPSSIAYCAKGKNYSIKNYGWSYDKISQYSEKKLLPVYQFSVDGELIKKYDSLPDVCAKTNYKKGAICNCCKSTSKTAYGFIWSYDENYKPLCGEWGRKTKKPVMQYDLNDVFMQKYNSISEASKCTGLFKSSISKACKGMQNICGSYKFKFLVNAA